MLVVVSRILLLFVLVVLFGDVGIDVAGCGVAVMVGGGCVVDYGVVVVVAWCVAGVVVDAVDGVVGVFMLMLFSVLSLVMLVVLLLLVLVACVLLLMCVVSAGVCSDVDVFVYVVVVDMWCVKYGDVLGVVDGVVCVDSVIGVWDVGSGMFGGVV